MTKCNFAEKPHEVETVVIDNFVHVYIRDNIAETEDGWTANEYYEKLPVGAEVDAEKIKEHDRAVTAERMRAERNRLLAESDSQMVADRPSDKEAWASYRQALRDITEDPQFPYCDLPEMPR